jgi:hypothetical protein
MEIQQYKLEDNEIKMVELKDVYNEVLSLNVQFYSYYKNMAKIDRTFRGDVINSKIAEMMDLSSKMYFNKETTDFDLLYLKLKEIEFHSRVMYKTKTLPNKAKTVLQKIYGNLGLHIKCLKENELRK